MQLTNAEEQIMKYLWKLEKAYLKNILNQFPEPKPATTTIATLLKRMIDKQFVGYNQHGSNREYYPLVSKEKYTKGYMNGFIKNYFSNSYKNMVSFFSKHENLSVKEIEEIISILQEQIDSQKKK
ncbi:MAG: BlaI/MecI/CopY family transcriptional regulator [Bacteroidales bacterium]|nr:BlaI/MecI/CopY family transcriptional regulator [Bacteroidales bacterium]